jgi:hypothetical protein
MIGPKFTQGVSMNPKLTQSQIGPALSDREFAEGLVRRLTGLRARAT